MHDNKKQEGGGFDSQGLQVLWLLPQMLQLGWPAPRRPSCGCQSAWIVLHVLCKAPLRRQVGPPDADSPRPSSPILQISSGRLNHRVDRSGATLVLAPLAA